MKILIIDNFDSFTYNLAQYFGELGVEVAVHRNNAISLQEIAEMAPDAIVISPGPGVPRNAGITLETITEFAGRIPILGVCLGHQAIAEAFGGRVVRAPELMHGKISAIHHDGRGVYAGLPNPFPATRYHSLIVEEASLPGHLRVTSRTESGLIMGLEHHSLPVVGVQFHPESVLTEAGKTLLRNFLDHYVKSPASQTQSQTPSANQRECAMLQQMIGKVLAGQDLDRREAYEAMNCIMNGDATPAQIGGFLAALRMKGETPAEIAGFAASMREKAARVRMPQPNTIDLCGTGGDGKHTFNISTVATFVAAGAGVPVAKHGNRSVSSKSGSADVLKALGVQIDLDPEQMSRCLEEVGLAFLFAPKLHGAMKHAIGPRRELGVRTVFNILGPITNPAGVRRQLIGVYDRKLLRLLAEVLQQLEAEHVLLVHSEEGMDEISLAGKTFVAELKNGDIREYAITADDFGLPASADGLTGGDAGTNAAIAERILSGEKGPARDIVIANAAAGIYVAGLAGDLREAAVMAAESIDSGAALQKLNALRQFTQRLAA